MPRNSSCTLMIGVFESSGIQLDIIKWVVLVIISLPTHRDRAQIKQHVFFNYIANIKFIIWILQSMGGLHIINHGLITQLILHETQALATLNNWQI